MKNIWVNGKIICRMDWEYIYGMILIMKINFLEIGILENGKTGKEMDMGILL